MAKTKQQNTQVPPDNAHSKRTRRVAQISPGATCLLPIQETEQRVGLRKTKLYEMIKAGEFPKPIKVGVRSLWPSPAVEAWIADQIAAQSGDA